MSRRRRNPRTPKRCTGAVPNTERPNLWRACLIARRDDRERSAFIRTERVRNVGGRSLGSANGNLRKVIENKNARGAVRPPSPPLLKGPPNQRGMLDDTSEWFGRRVTARTPLRKEKKRSRTTTNIGFSRWDGRRQLSKPGTIYGAPDEWAQKAIEENRAGNSD